MSNVQQEIWKDIPDFEGLYQISNYGRVKSLSRKTAISKAHSGRTALYTRNTPEKIMNPKQHSRGYLKIMLCKNSIYTEFFIHRLVAAVFIENPENKLEVNHKNLIKNDNRVDNLEWVTHRENNIHARKNLTFRKGNKKGSESFNAKPVLQLSESGEELFIWGCIIDAARFYNICSDAIRQSINISCKSLGFVWQRVSREYYLENKHKFSAPPVYVADKWKRDTTKTRAARKENISKVTKEILVTHGVLCRKSTGELKRDIYESYARQNKVPGYRYVINLFKTFAAFKEEVCSSLQN